MEVIKIILGLIILVLIFPLHEIGKNINFKVRLFNNSYGLYYVKKVNLNNFMIILFNKNLKIINII